MSKQYQLIGLTPFEQIAHACMESMKKAGMAVKLEEVTEERTGNIVSIRRTEEEDDSWNGTALNIPSYTTEVIVTVDTECLCNGIYTLDVENDHIVVRYGTEEEGDKYTKPLNALTGELLVAPLKEKEFVTLVYKDTSKRAVVTSVTLDRFAGVIVWLMRIERVD